MSPSCEGTGTELAKQGTPVQQSNRGAAGMPLKPRLVLGTGWPIKQDLVVTNNHVVNGVQRIGLMSVAGDKLRASALVAALLNDLAILQVEDSQSLPAALPLTHDETAFGMDAFTLGYPDPSIFGGSIRLTNGIINSLTGLVGDLRTYQTTLPVHAGNGGGRLINPTGAAVGAVTSKLSVVKMLEYSADFPENVSLAVKSSYLVTLLKSMPNRPPKLKELPIESRPLHEIAKSVQDSMLLAIGL